MESSRKRKRKATTEASGEQGEEAEPIIRRQFRQHRAKGKKTENGEIGKESSEKVKRLLSKVF